MQQIQHSGGPLFLWETLKRKVSEMAHNFICLKRDLVSGMTHNCSLSKGPKRVSVFPFSIIHSTFPLLSIRMSPDLVTYLMWWPRSSLLRGLNSWSCLFVATVSIRLHQNWTREYQDLLKWIFWMPHIFFLTVFCNRNPTSGWMNESPLVWCKVMWCPVSGSNILQILTQFRK